MSVEYYGIQLRPVRTGQEGFLWIPMDSHTRGFPQAKEDSYGFLWIPMDSYTKWFPQANGDPYRFQ